MLPGPSPCPKSGLPDFGIPSAKSATADLGGSRSLSSGRPKADPLARTSTDCRWYDLVFDRCANGQQLKCLTMTDEFTKGKPARRFRQV